MKKFVTLFVIGYTASVIAILAPKAFEAFTIGWDKTTQLSAPEWTLLILVPPLIGVLMAYWKRNATEEVIETFVAALGLPAVLAGGITVSGASSELSNMSTDLKEIEEIVRGLQKTLVLAKTQTLEQAQEKADALKRDTPGLTTDIKKSGNEFVVIKKGETQEKAKALEDKINFTKARLRPFR